MWLDDFDKLFDSAFRDFMRDSFKRASYYGYTMKIGADGRPEFREFGNTEKLLPQKPTTNIDEIISDDEVKYVVEMAGLEKNDIKIDIVDDMLKINGERGERKYHEQIALKYKIDGTPKATYKNGVLEITFSRYKPKTQKIDVE